MEGVSIYALILLAVSTVPVWLGIVWMKMAIIVQVSCFNIFGIIEPEVQKIK